MMTLELQIDGVAVGDLQAVSLEGQEAISRPYGFEVMCLVTAPRTPGAEWLGRAATVTLTPSGGVARRVAGVVESLVVGLASLYDEPLVKVVIGPRLARLRLSRRSQVYGTVDPVSVKEVITSAMEGQLQAGALAPDSDDRTVPFDIRLRHAYPQRPHVTQYEESDLDFISRLAEHFGIAYFFELAEEQERVVFCDDPVFMPLLSAPATLSWSPLATGETMDAPESIQRIRATYQQIPNQVLLKDYNELAPLVSLTAAAVADPAGLGNVIEYGAHYQTPEEGAFLARVRAEALRCRKERFLGESRVARLSAGCVFTLAGHTNDAWNDRYLVVSVTHQARVAVQGVAGLPTAAGGAEGEYGYQNHFEAIRLSTDTPFRPERVTPWPHVPGLLNGRIETPEDGSTEPHLDANGWYRVRLPLDCSQAPSGQASRWVRKAEAYGGASSGMHFPLPPGTDVVLACVNGDPDRLVIVGAPPSADNQSVVTQAVSSLNRIQTRSGIRITMSDLPPG